MTYLLDQDVPADVCRVLRQAGYDVLTATEVLDPDATDEEVLNYAASKRCVLVTGNRDDFLGLASSVAHAGIIILIRRRSRIAECAALLQFIARAGEAGIDRNINFA